jgi:Protein of unknown function (DUF736)
MISLKLDDPSFHAPIVANLTQDDDRETYSLIWSRRTALAELLPTPRPERSGRNFLRLLRPGIVCGRSFARRKIVVYDSFEPPPWFDPAKARNVLWVPS